MPDFLKLDKATQNIGDAVDKASETVEKAIPAAEEALKDVSSYATNSLLGLLTFLASKIDGAECPVDITVTATTTVRIVGKVGALKLSELTYEVAKQ